MFNNTVYFTVDIQNLHDLYCKWHTFRAFFTARHERAGILHKNPSSDLIMRWGGGDPVIQCNAENAAKIDRLYADMKSQVLQQNFGWSVEIDETALGYEVHETGPLVFQTDSKEATYIHGGCDKFTVVVRGMMPE